MSHVTLHSLFQSTPPRREVTRHPLRRTHRRVISIHTSPKGGDSRCSPFLFQVWISIHTSPKGGDLFAARR